MCFERESGGGIILHHMFGRKQLRQYNIFTNGLHRYADRLDAFTAEFTAILSRHLDAQTNKKAA